MAGLEDGSFVDDFTKQQSCRPKYTRVISWELSRDTNEDPAEKRKKRRSCERKMRKEKRIVEHRRERKSQNDSESSSSSVQSEYSEEGNNVTNDKDNETTHSNTTELAKPKIGKKAKHRLVKESLEWAISDLIAIDLDATSDLVDSPKPIVEFEVSNKPVPSLVDLCLRVDWKTSGSECEIKISDIAPGLRNIVRTKQQMCRTNAQHLKCLHRTLASREKDYTYYLEGDADEKDEKGVKKSQIFQRTLSSLFLYANARSGFRDLEILGNNFQHESGYRTDDGVLDGKWLDLLIRGVKCRIWSKCKHVIRVLTGKPAKVREHSLDRGNFTLKTGEIWEFF